MDVLEDSTPSHGTSATRLLDCASLVRSISLNPLSARSWHPEDIKIFLGWLLWESKLHQTVSPYQHRQDIFILHSILSSGVFHVDGLLTPFADGVVETALSLAVERNDVDMIKYLLQMGASPDVLIGPALSVFNKPSMYASDRACPTYQSLIVEHGKAPTRHPIHGEKYLHDMEYDMADNNVFFQVIQTEKMVDVFDRGIEYEIAQMSANPDIVSTWTRIQRAFVYARLNQRRPNGPLEKEFEQISLLLRYKGDITVDSYMIDEAVERKTALYEALKRRNLPEVQWLLEVQKADPNQVCLTGGMLWDEVVAESFPIEQALRGFLVTTVEQSADVERMMELLLVHGCSEVTQGESLKRTLKENWSRLPLVCLEVLHFMKCTNHLHDRSPDVFTEEVRNEFNIRFPLMLQSCERKWFEEKLERSLEAQNLQLVLQEVPAFLHRVTPPERFGLLPQSFRGLTIHRAYRSLAVLLQTYGGRLSLIEPFSHILTQPIPHLEDVYNDMYQALGCRSQDAVTANFKRVTALITILARLFPVSIEVKNFLLQYLRVLAVDENAVLDENLYCLKNRCISVIQQEVSAGRMTQVYVVSILPPTLYSDVFMSERELLIVAEVQPSRF